MSDAVIALIGAIVGGAMTSASNVGIEMVRQNRVEKDRGRAEGNQAEVERREMRLAARLVLAELRHARVVIKAAKKGTGGWTTGPKELLPVDAWSTHRLVLAGRFSDKEWDSTQSAYRYIEAMRLGDTKSIGIDEVASGTIDAIELAVRTLQPHGAAAV
jgi:hypothetical protein